MSSANSDRDPVEKLAEEFLARFRKGERPSLTEYTDRYPEHADDIRELFPALVEMEDLGPVTADWPNRRTATSSAPIEELALQQLGDYRIVRKIGGGGMGIVYEATRGMLGCNFALKVLRPEYRNDRGYRRKFQKEARAAARLLHTNIVPVVDFGEQEGVLYYVMQYIPGQGLDRVLADVRQLRPSIDGPAAADGVGAVAPAGAMLGASGEPTVAQSLLAGGFTACHGSERALNHARLPDSTSTAAQTGETALDDEEPLNSAKDAPAGVVDTSSATLAGKSASQYHRGVARVAFQVAEALVHAHSRGVLHRDIKPSNLLLDARGNAWVTDFGLAKFDEGDNVSQSHEIAGTWRYMAPERFKGESDGRSDIYSLGASLYEMLTLRPAFDGSDRIRLMERIIHETPVPPRQIERQIPIDLETIVLKAMAKSPADRYPTAAAVAEDIKLFSEGRPIRSRPIPFYQRFWRWCRRNPKLAAASIAAAVLTVILAVGSTFAAWTYRQQRDRIGRAENRTRSQLFEALHDRARAGRHSQRVGQRFDSLLALRQAAVIGRELKLPREELDKLRDEAIACMALPDLKPTGRVIQLPTSVIAFAFDEMMTRYALRSIDGTVLVRQVADDQEIARFHARGDRDIWVFDFSPDGRYLATVHRPDETLTVWEVDRRSVSLECRRANLYGAKFSPDSRRIVVGHPDGSLVVCDVTTGAASRKWTGIEARIVAFRPDGTQLAAICAEKATTCKILDVETGRLIRSIDMPPPGVFDAVAWSPDGSTLAIISRDARIHLWDTTTGIQKATFEGSRGGGLRVAFHPAGTLLASNSWENRLRLFDAVLGRPWLTVTGRTNPDLSQDGRVVVCRDDSLTTYQVDPALEYRTFAHPSSDRLYYDRPSARIDGRIVAVGTVRGVILWDLANGAELAFLPVEGAVCPIFETSGALLTCGSSGVQRWPMQLDLARAELRIGPPSRLSAFPPGQWVIGEDRSGRIVAMAHGDHAHVTTPERAFQVGPLDDCRSVAVSPDGKWLATGNHQVGGARVWRIADGTLAAKLPIERGAGVKFSPDGKWLFAAHCGLFEVGTWRLALQIEGEAPCFSPDGRLLVVQDSTRIIRLVEIETGLDLARLESPDLCEVYAATFSHDGSQLVLTTGDGPALHVWDLRAVRRGLAKMGLDWHAPAYPDVDPAAQSVPAAPLKVIVNMRPVGESQSLLQQAQRLQGAGKVGDAIDVLRKAVGLAPDHAALHNDVAWLLATGPGTVRNPLEAVEHARRAVELAPDNHLYLNTLGVALERAGKFAEAVEILEKSLAAGKGALAAFDLFFLAMAHRRLENRVQARSCFDRAVRWLAEHPELPGQYTKELAAFRAEAEAILGLNGDAGELPADVFAPDSRSMP
jgi:serine/threonine protein kinase/WD40 repeat protein